MSVVPILGFRGFFSPGPLFLISSIIHPPLTPTGQSTRSVFSDTQRLWQTVKTCQSIRAHFKDASILLLELSQMTPDEINILLPHLSQIILFHEHPQALKYSKKENRSFGELFCIREVLQYLDNKSCPILYKLSGRYQLTRDFDPSQHSNGKIVFREGMFGLNPRQKYTKVPESKDHYYYTVLYSVPPNLIDKFRVFLEECWKKMIENNQDIEHLVYQIIPKDYVELHKRLGCGGQLSTTGKIIYL